MAFFRDKFPSLVGVTLPFDGEAYRGRPVIVRVSFKGRELPKGPYPIQEPVQAMQFVIEVVPKIRTMFKEGGAVANERWEDIFHHKGQAFWAATTLNRSSEGVEIVIINCGAFSAQQLRWLRNSLSHFAEEYGIGLPWAPREQIVLLPARVQPIRSLAKPLEPEPELAEQEPTVVVTPPPNSQLVPSPSILFPRPVVLREDRITKAVCVHYALDHDTILGPCRKANIAHARHVLMYLLRNEMGLPYDQIAKLVGGRDHSTAMSGINKITNMIANLPSVATEVAAVREMVYGIEMDVRAPR